MVGQFEDGRQQKKRISRCDFTEFLPCCLSEDIFEHLDVCSVCSSSQVSRNWHDLINTSRSIWRSLYCNIEGQQSHAIKNYLHAEQWKDLVAERYAVIRQKSKWLKGNFSNITSYKDLENMNSVCQFSQDDWGDILQMELSR